MQVELKNNPQNTNTVNIKKNWFYKLSEISTTEIFIDDGIEAFIFDDTPYDLNIAVWEKSKLNYFAFYDKPWNFSKNIVSNWNDSQVIINTLFLSKDTKLISKVHWTILANNCKMYLNLLSFAMNNWDLEVDGIFEIAKSLENTKWFLDEENIFLWDKAKIKALPKLFVESNDIEAWHSCKMERISDDKLFYLRSRGIWKQNALTIMIEAKVVDLFWDLNKMAPDFYMSLKENILEKIW